jgi:hypothetical protein
MLEREGGITMAAKKSKAMAKRPQDLKKSKDLTKKQIAKAVGGAFTHKNSKGDTYY